VSVRIVPIVVALALLSSRSSANPACLDEKLIAETAGVISVPEIRPWSLKLYDFQLRPEQIVPTAFLEKVSKEVGPIKFSAYQETFNLMRVQMSTESSGTFGHAILFQQSNHPDALTIEHLSIQDPTVAPDQKRLAKSQSKPGAPMSVFQYATKQIGKVALAGGYRKIRTNGAQNYAVAMLYRKVARMNPEGDISHRYHTMLDRYYEYAKREAPESFRVTSLNDFVLLTGTYGEELVPLEVADLWSDFRSTGKLPPSMELVRDKNGSEMAVFYQPLGGTKRLFFVDNVYESKPLFDWDFSEKNFWLSLESPDL
jgi:hypothetical protein